ncbi:MAG: rRNA maturation RNase YbeY [Sulfurimicrobium sp.]|jgi:probable rRNA maturation factor|nr:rRNA maturation RNase YbeY [Sulfurimicrobium sp.]MDZ7656920.1 rRNA maturation RNase YbeY [Sulfurimicrobium sp.]
MKKTKPDLNLSVQYAYRPTDVPPRSLFRKWVCAAQESGAAVTIRIVSEEEGRALNRDYRGKDYATNVLSFVYEQAPLCQGDLVLSAAVVSREALEQGKSVEAHYAHMIVHGMLHLQGYDHEDDADAQAMEAVETHIMRRLGYTDPYAIIEVEQQHG